MTVLGDNDVIDHTAARAAFATTWAQAMLGILARGWNGPPAAEAGDEAPLPAWAPRPDALFRSTRAAFGSQR
jgi:hypothetical protein